MLPSSVFAWVLLLWRVVESREFSRGMDAVLIESKGEIWGGSGMMKIGVLPTEDKGDRSNSVEVISGDTFDISSIYMLICCTMNTKYVCYPYRVTFCGVSFLDWWEIYTFMILKFGNKRLLASLYVSIYNCYWVFTTSQFFSAWFFLISLCIFLGFHPTVLPLADG
jgi:hypothetical protein